MLMTRPKPRHVGQAPTGWLKLNRAGEGSRYSMSQSAQCRRLENSVQRDLGRSHLASRVQDRQLAFAEMVGLFAGFDKAGAVGLRQLAGGPG